MPIALFLIVMMPQAKECRELKPSRIHPSGFSPDSMSASAFPTVNSDGFLSVPLVYTP